MSYFFLLCLIAPVFSSHLVQHGVSELAEEQWEPESPAANYLGLSSGASKVVPNIKVTFTCSGRRYGYFADVDNECKIFHVCHPSVAANGEPVIYQFTKFCPNQTRFDQKQLSCVTLTHPDLIPCSQSQQYFPATESRFAEPAAPVQQTIQRFPETEQRFEQVLEQRQETPVVKSQPQPQNVVFKNVEPFQQTLLTEPVVPFTQFRSFPSKQEVRNVETPNPAIGNSEIVAPEVKVRNTLQTAQPIAAQPIAASPVQITRPVLLESDVSLRRSVPQTVNSFVDQTQNTLPQMQPLQVTPQVYSQFQPYVPLSQTRVIRPLQNTGIPKQFLSSSPFISNFQTVPQFLRTVSQPNVVRPAQNPTFIQV